MDQPRLVVADAGPLTALARIDQIDLLPTLHGRVHVPEDVWHEVVVCGAGLPGSSLLSAASWVDRGAPLEGDPVLRALDGLLDPGEAAAITTAVGRQADLLLIDERKGRRIARSLGLTVKGTLGVLLAARRLGHLRSLGEVVEALRHNEVHLSDELVAEVLRVSGEG